MTLCEERLDEAYEKGLITYYDYKVYEQEGKKANYDNEFIDKLPDLYFLGCPIKEIIKNDWSDGKCHALSVAIGLCFDNFKIVTCNLKHYNEFLNYYKTGRFNCEFEHSFTLVEINGKQMAIDPVFCMITDYDTYKYIFGVEAKYVLDSEKLKETEPIKFIIKHIKDKAPDIGKKTDNPKNEQLYQDEINEYVGLCLNYKNYESFYLENFIKKCLLPTSNITIINNWRIISYNHNKKADADSFLFSDKDIDNNKTYN